VAVIERDGIKLGVANVIGSGEGTVAHRACEDAERAVAELAEAAADLVLVDIHAGWPAEKLGIATVLDGRVCAVLGTHTHVPTADARVLPGGTAYISDVGMTGAADSLIGFRPEGIVEQIRRADAPLPAPADGGEGVLMGVLVTARIDGRAVAIEPLRAFVDARVTVEA
jgi:calcineurin-like phosphoesterase